MPQCAVATCRNSHRRTRGRRIRYHRFPQIPEVRARWVRACGRPPLSNGDVPFNIQTARICSLHFTNDSYEKDMEHLVLGLPVRSRLRRGAVPTIGVPVNVQPVTKMLVDDAKRSILKVTHGKYGKDGKDGKYGDEGIRSHDEGIRYYRKFNDEDGNVCQQLLSGEQQKMAGIDVLLALGLKPASSLNKMHAMDCATSSPSSGKAEKREDDSRNSPKVPQNRQNGAALPEETATPAVVKKENHSDEELTDRKKTRSKDRKRKSTEESFANGNPKRICFEQRERFIDSLVGCDRISPEELATRADELRSEVQALDELARAKEMEWNEILSMRKLKEEAYLRVERKRQVLGYLESNGQITETIPSASLSLAPDWEPPVHQDPQPPKDIPQDLGHPPVSKSPLEPQTIPQKSQSRQLTVSQVSNRLPQEKRSKRTQDVHQDSRQIGEGRQGPLLDVRSVIAEHRLRHPETVPRRGRRMRNSVNIGLGAGGGVVETVHDSRPSSTDSCKSGSNPDVNYKDIQIQFAKYARQEMTGTVKTPQNYPDVTLHPVASGPTPGANPGGQGSLLHGILTKSHSPRPTTFSPTLAKLLTAPERDRGQAQVAQMVQGFQGNTGVSISDLLNSSKARREITITPVGNTPLQSSHPNNIVHVEDVEEENSLIEERDSRRTSSRDNREDRDTPPRCQGCQERAAQFVCAGCGNQWYCSRECQVSAWDEHSEVCSG
ncbi:uncharacterized protein [Fopius arisanus]|uniref:Uncharacterized protein isoform X1 n=2 Tax=Fopius arisanus TaxID=64838 RepID=A0A9R1U665_9HYME|nr:PREDICTED: uncharacterized protein LOC105269942 isoform X1 [Fopius arisanus]